MPARRGLVVGAAVVVASLVAAAAALTAPAPRPGLATTCDTPTSTTLDQTPVASPRGDSVAFVRAVWRTRPYSQDTGIFRIGLDGRGLAKLSGATSDPRHPVWSPDGRTVAFLANDTPSTEQLYVVPAGGGAPRRLVSYPSRDDDGVWSPAWSPDSRSLAYLSEPGDIHVVELASGSDRTLAGFHARVLAWAPSARITVEVEETGTIDTVAADGSGRTTIVQLDGTYVGTFAWSPDGGTLAFSSSPGARSQVWSVLPGGAPRLLVGDANQPAWSPDGRRLAVIRGPLQWGILNVVDPADGSRRRVSHDSSRVFGSSLSNPSWSADGRTLVFQSDTHASGIPADGDELRLVGANGGNERRLTYHCLVAPRGKQPVVGTWLPDVILARDHIAQTISCGAGYDRVVADRGDVTTGCESVARGRAP